MKAKRQTMLPMF